MSNIVPSRKTINENIEYIPPKKLRYPMSDLDSVFTHWSPELGRNVATENKLNGGNNNGKSGK